MQAHKFTIRIDGNEYWQLAGDGPADWPFERRANFKAYDELANGFMWTMKTKCGKQRNWRLFSMRTASIYAMLDAVKEQFAENVNVQVVVLTPDVEIEFIV